jgi:hypothetical protein
MKQNYFKARVGSASISMPVNDVPNKEQRQEGIYSTGYSYVRGCSQCF